MEGVGAYILSVTAGAIFCGIMMSLTGKINTAGTIRLLTGLIMALILIRPVFQIELRGLERYWRSFGDEADRLVEQGRQHSRSAMAEQVMDSVEARIRSHGTELGLNIEVSVSVNDEDLPVPTCVSITGNASPHERESLTMWITENLGLGEEDVHWNGAS